MDSKFQTPCALIIMDGYGLAPAGPGNAISLADTPNIDHLMSSCPAARLDASGEAVGLPAGQMGNSEVGHLNIGAGRVVHQELSRINNACRSGEIASNPVIVKAFETVCESQSVLHFMGLLSDGGVHSSDEHLFAFMDLAAQMKVPRVFIHCFMDGRDVPPSSGLQYLARLRKHIESLEGSETEFAIAGMAGRYYAMDRDKRWDRVKAFYDALVHARPQSDQTPEAYLEASYADGITDEFVHPVSFVGRHMDSDDVVLFFNFRPDRARQITRALTDKAFDGFDRGEAAFPHFVCLTEYADDIDAPIAFPKTFPEQVLADVVASAGLRQYHIAETEKYAHVTFFLNGGREEPKPDEERCLVPSPKVATYDLQPQMSEPEVAADLADAIDGDDADFYVVNFANCDMVGHTGVVEAAVEAVQAVDAGVGSVLAALKRKGGCALVTADHGNADKMIADDGQPFTAHTTNPVPLILVDFGNRGWTLNRERGALCDIAPTLLEMMGIPIPAAMTGSSLLAKTC